MEKQEVEPLTDNTSSSPFWKECRRGRIKSQEREEMYDESNVSWEQNALKPDKMRTTLHVSSWADDTSYWDQAAADRQNTQPSKEMRVFFRLDLS